MVLRGGCKLLATALFQGSSKMSKQSPKRKPFPIDQSKDTKPLPTPKKYAAFSDRDSRSVETAFQKMVADELDKRRDQSPTGDIGDPGSRQQYGTYTKDGDGGDHENANTGKTHGSRGNTSINEATSSEKGGMVKVPVNEDFLFDVDIEARELAPTYWLGPIYDVRRGSWFYQEGSSLRPCDENLAIQLEEGYLKVKPWRNELLQPSPSPKSRPVSMNAADVQKSTGVTEKSKEEPSIPVKFELQTQRLFGAYMNSMVTYQDAMTAWLLTDDFLSRMSSTVYQRFAGGGHLGGVKVVRGYSEAEKAKETKKDGDGLGTKKNEAAMDNTKGRSESPNADKESSDHDQLKRSISAAQQEPRLVTLERQLSSFSDDPAKQEEERRQADEDEIKEDYKDADSQDQGREIEHLILVTHGIGQVNDFLQSLSTLLLTHCSNRGLDCVWKVSISFMMSMSSARLSKVSTKHRPISKH